MDKHKFRVRGKMSTEVGERSGRPKEVVTEENIIYPHLEIHKMILNDYKLKLNEISDTLKISTERVHHIIHKYLGMRELCAKWVPREITFDQKQRRVCLKMIKRNKPKFLRRYVTIDESPIDSHPSEMHAMNPLQCVGKCNSRLARTINSDYYLVLMDYLKDKIVEKRPNFKKNIVLLHQVNAPYHKLVKMMAKIHEFGFDLLPHPPYSPDLATSNHFLLSDVKRMLVGKNCS
ncbi:hypothetical protein GWI33_018193 [Rhynchophorus ferrugineus]|uniref:Transposase n=1 Tax=Rhynchophorus ferrugineus TaxID=354439 RepID=A0A834HWL6_RHYFE|nr:hypothetical protein GWI33_018193 [Rhynchophorus ferrugineus]